MPKNFLLAPDKDLAVSPSHYCEAHPEGQDALAFQLRRLCSHLYPAKSGTAGVTRYLFRPRRRRGMGVRTFLLPAKSRKAIIRPAFFILIKKGFLSIFIF